MAECMSCCLPTRDVWAYQRVTDLKPVTAPRLPDCVIVNGGENDTVSLSVLIVAFPLYYVHTDYGRCLDLVDCSNGQSRIHYLLSTMQSGGSGQLHAGS
jgi:hypothetical protein